MSRGENVHTTTKLLGSSTLSSGEQFITQLIGSITIINLLWWMFYCRFHQLRLDEDLASDNSIWWTCVRNRWCHSGGGVELCLISYALMLILDADMVLIWFIHVEQSRQREPEAILIWSNRYHRVVVFTELFQSRLQNKHRHKLFIDNRSYSLNFND